MRTRGVLGLPSISMGLVIPLGFYSFIVAGLLTLFTAMPSLGSGRLPYVFSKGLRSVYVATLLGAPVQLVLALASVAFHVSAVVLGVSHLAFMACLQGVLPGDCAAVFTNVITVSSRVLAVSSALLLALRLVLRSRGAPVPSYLQPLLALVLLATLAAETNLVLHVVFGVCAAIYATAAFAIYHMPCLIGRPRVRVLEV